MLYYAPSPPNILLILLSVRNPHLSLLPIPERTIHNIPLSIHSVQSPYSFTNVQSPSSASSQSSVYNPQHPLRPGSSHFFEACASPRELRSSNEGYSGRVWNIRRNLSAAAPYELHFASSCTNYGSLGCTA